MDGPILKAFIESRKLNKTQLAEDLGMSKQNLYQLFDSKEFKPETIKLVEKYFKVKWGRVKSSVNIDGVQAKDQKALHELNHSLLKKILKVQEQILKKLPVLFI